jgi:hypothetical protein
VSGGSIVRGNISRLKMTSKLRLGNTETKTVLSSKKIAVYIGLLTSLQ